MNTRSAASQRSLLKLLSHISRLNQIVSLPLLGFRMAVRTLRTKAGLNRSAQSVAHDISMKSTLSISAIPKIVINLDERTDRFSEFREMAMKNELGALERFSAIMDRNGALGCARSHYELMIRYRNSPGFKLGIVFEDDFEPLAPIEKMNSLIRTFAQDDRLDVLCICAEHWGPAISIGGGLKISTGVQTTACYVVKAQALDKLLVAFEKSIRRLERGWSPQMAAIDITWKSSQRSKLIFAFPEEKMARQRPSYSDIERRWVAY